MKIKEALSLPFAFWIRNRIRRWDTNAIKLQEKTLAHLIKSAKGTLFGKEHKFSNIKNPQDFCNYVPIRDYEGLKPYIERIKNGEKDIFLYLSSILLKVIFLNS